MNFWLRGSWLNTQGRVKGMTQFLLRGRSEFHLFSKAFSRLDLFNCRDLLVHGRTSENENMPALFGRAWEFLSRAFLEVLFPAQLLPSRGNLQLPSGSAGTCSCLAGVWCCWRETCCLGVQNKLHQRRIKEKTLTGMATLFQRSSTEKPASKTWPEWAKGV